MVNGISKIGNCYPAVFGCCIIMLTGCVQPVEKNKVETVNNTECIARVNDNPRLVYQQMIDCVNKSQNQRAAYLYAQAGTLTWYQSLVDKNETSRIAHRGLLTDALAKLSSSEREEFTKILETTFDDNNSRQQICSQLITPKNYHNAVDENRYSDKWLLAKKGYLHCI